MDVALLVSPMGRKSAERFTDVLDPVIDSSEVILYFRTASFSRRAAGPTGFRLRRTLAELALRKMFGFLPPPPEGGTLRRLVGRSEEEAAEGELGVLGGEMTMDLPEVRDVGDVARSLSGVVVSALW